MANERYGQRPVVKKRWRLMPSDEALKTALSRDLNILPLTAQILVNRGIVDIQKASSFLSAELKDLHDPFLMKDMDRAVLRIIKALEDKDAIAVYGDYDVDGTTSTALLILFFKELSVDVITYIPERLKHGYGLNNNAIAELARKGAKLLITVDCGVSNHDEAVFARSVGIDLIITDHHEPPPRLPPAYALLNPRQSECLFPFKGLAGVGVAFNLIIALRTRLRDMGWFNGPAPNLKKYLDLVCIGTIADVVPLQGENRVFVKHGLEVLKTSARPGLKALKDTALIKDTRLAAETVSYQIAPRLNAPGRLDNAMLSLELLTTEDAATAARLAMLLDSENSERQAIEQKILAAALSMCELEARDKGIVLFSKGWHPGVIGVVASRLAERFTRPCLMIAIEGDVAKGSARGIKNFDILKGLETCGGFLERFGGHRAAAGFTVKSENLHAFKEAMISVFNSTLTDEDIIPEITLDAELSLDEVDLRLVSEIERLSPFGKANPEPRLCARAVTVLSSAVVAERHLRLNVMHKGAPKKAIAFGMAGLKPSNGYGCDLAFIPYIDTWDGKGELRLKVLDFKESS
ncbi:MAG: single-stranded-DNA-specific exonuclease RecJ [Deltaproteobacteria bacterium]|nr:single-stranded-DNA-specific exonuclease RecJ [Deltaproteobacteria bacterium]